MPAPSLDDFLKHNVQDYLFNDITSMTGPLRAGGCGYPLLMTVCSGIELLGALSSYLPQPFALRGMGDKYFLEYWENALYPASPRRDAGRVVYQLARHGLAHSFVTKGDLLVMNESGKRHFANTPDGVIINSNELALDFQQSYSSEFIAKRLKAHRPAIEKRLQEMWNEYTNQASKLWHLFAPLPTSASVPGASGSAQPPSPPSSAAPHGATGPVVGPPGATGPTILTTKVSKF